MLNANVSEEVLDVRNASDEEIKLYLKLFFNGQKKPNGEKITYEELMTSEHIDWVRSFSFSSVVDIAYLSLKENGYVGTDYVFIMRHQRVARQLEIPQKYSNGLILVYLKLVMGHDL